jgi:hypothetical protein
MRGCSPSSYLYARTTRARDVAARRRRPTRSATRGGCEATVSCCTPIPCRHAGSAGTAPHGREQEHCQADSSNFQQRPLPPSDSGTVSGQEFAVSVYVHVVISCARQIAAARTSQGSDGAKWGLETLRRNEPSTMAFADGRSRARRQEQGQAMSASVSMPPRHGPRNCNPMESWSQTRSRQPGLQPPWSRL